MNTCLRLLITVTAFSLIGCGSDKDKDKPPPPTSSPVTEQGRYDVLHLAQRARMECQQAVAPAFLNVAGQIQAGAAAQPVAANLSNCQKLATEMFISLNTLYGPQGGYRYAMDFVKAQAWALANGIGRNLASSGYPPNAQTLPLYFAAGAGMLQGIPGGNPLMAGVRQMAIQSLLQR